MLVSVEARRWPCIVSFGVEVTAICGLPSLLYGCYNPNSSLYNCTVILLTIDPSPYTLEHWFLLVYFWFYYPTTFIPMRLWFMFNNQYSKVREITSPSVLDSSQNMQLTVYLFLDIVSLRDMLTNQSDPEVARGSEIIACERWLWRVNYLIHGLPLLPISPGYWLHLKYCTKNCVHISYVIDRGQGLLASFSDDRCEMQRNFNWFRIHNNWGKGDCCWAGGVCLQDLFSVPLPLKTLVRLTNRLALQRDLAKLVWSIVFLCFIASKTPLSSCKMHPYCICLYEKW